MKQTPASRALGAALSQFLTPQVWKQDHQAWRSAYAPPRWALQPLVWVLLTMTWSSGQSQEERFATARAVYVAHHQRSRSHHESLHPPRGSQGAGAPGLAMRSFVP